MTIFFAIQVACRESWHVSGAVQVSGVNETVVGGLSLESKMTSNNFSELGSPLRNSLMFTMTTAFILSCFR